jgi:Family of unknown function (DUF6152)
MYTANSRSSARPRVALVMVVTIVTALAGALPAMAHHAFAAEYDADQPVELTGTVTKAKWVNPHSRVLVDVRNPDGTVTNWSFEFGAPNALEGRGLSKADLQPGAQVFIKGFRSKNGGPFGYSVTLTLPDGRSFQTGGAPDTPAGRDSGEKPVPSSARP